MKNHIPGDIELIHFFFFYISGWKKEKSFEFVKDEINFLIQLEKLFFSIDSTIKKYTCTYVIKIIMNLILFIVDFFFMNKYIYKIFFSTAKKI